MHAGETLKCRNFNVSPPLEACKYRHFNLSVLGGGRGIAPRCLPA